MSHVNLLPPEIRQKAKVRQRTAVVAVIGVGVLLLIFAFYLLQAMELSRVQEDLAAQEQTNGGLQTEIAALSDFGELQAELQEEQDLVDAVYANEISWSGVLRDVSSVIPDDAVLLTFTGASNVAVAADTAVTTTPAEGPVGTLTFSGTAAGTESLALWLSRQAEVRGWENPFMSTFTESETRSRIYDFSSTVDLFPEAITKRGRGEERPA